MGTVLPSGHYFHEFRIFSRCIMVERRRDKHPRRLIFQVSFYKLSDLPDDHDWPEDKE